MADEGGDRKAGPGLREEGPGDATHPAGGAPGDSVAPGSRPPWLSPLYRAANAGRYERQDLIRRYETTYDCRLIVIVDVLLDDSVPLVEELIFDANPERDLHVMLVSPGGDGESAVRLVRAAQQRCKELVVILPDQAKSAATIFTMGAHRVLMGPTSDLGPIDPQLQIADAWVAAKDVIDAVDRAQEDVARNPDSYPLHAALLSDVNALQVQVARSALARTDDLVEAALRSNPARDDREIESLIKTLREPLIQRPKSHAAIVGPSEARAAGLPVEELDPAGDQWRLIWDLWTRYLVMGPKHTHRIYEGARASHVIRAPVHELA